MQATSTPRLPARKSSLLRLIEFPEMQQWSSPDYRRQVRDCYDGAAGAVLHLASIVSLHEPLVGRLFRTGQIDLTGARSILDVGAGAGQILKHLIRYAAPDAELLAVDLSAPMLKRARRRMRSGRPHFLAADMTQLPAANDSFDCVTCGWALEYQLDPRPALREMHRVLKPGGKMILLATEDSLQGAMLSRAWKCRTYHREELREACDDCRLPWVKEHWLSPVHRALHAGGIIVEARKRS
jgi:ubiquinone/menaquinone biosynthesis C-methylase UbiE